MENEETQYPYDLNKITTGLVDVTIDGKTVEIPYIMILLPEHVLLEHKLTGIQGLGDNFDLAVEDFRATFNYCYGRLNQFEDHNLSKDLLYQKIQLNHLFK